MTRWAREGAFQGCTLTVYESTKNNPLHRVSFPLCVFILTAFWNPSPPIDSRQRHLLTPSPADFAGSHATQSEGLIAESAGLNGLAVKICKVIVSSHAWHETTSLFLYWRLWKGRDAFGVMPSSDWAVSSFRVQSSSPVLCFTFQFIHWALLFRTKKCSDRIALNCLQQILQAAERKAMQRVSTTTTEYFFQRDDVKRIEIWKTLHIFKS